MSDRPMLPLSRPDIGEKEIEAVIEVLRTPALSIGPKIEAFEAALAEAAGAREAVAVNSGTSALHLCVKALNLKEGDEVVTTPFSFVASANCLLFEGAIPVFSDIDPETMNLDPAGVDDRITPRTKAILPVHVFGRPCDMTRLLELARRRGLGVIEDACEAIGARHRGEKTGALGDCGAFAFYPNKQITTGEGGAVVTNQPEIARLCRSLRNQGRAEMSAWLKHERLGYNYRLSELNSALGLAQMGRLEEILQNRDRVARKYLDALRDNPFIEAHAEPPEGDRISWFVFVVRLRKDAFDRPARDAVIQSMRERGIQCGAYFEPIHLQPFYRERFGFREGDFPVTESVSDRTIALPFHTRMTDSEVDRVCETLRELMPDSAK